MHLHPPHWWHPLEHWAYLWGNVLKFCCHITDAVALNMLLVRYSNVRVLSSHYQIESQNTFILVFFWDLLMIIPFFFKFFFFYMNELNEFELFAVLLLFPVLCYPLTFWMKGWMCMGRLVVCCASWAPQWWWSTPRKKRRLPLLPPWQRSSKTQVQREVDQWEFTGVIWLTLLWKLNPFYNRVDGSFPGY